jgi:hypothetical protein
MSSAARAKKRERRRLGATISAAKPKRAVKPQTLAKKELNSFLALHVGEVTDAYLLGLATR